jgi:hypothetical protein
MNTARKFQKVLHIYSQNALVDSGHKFFSVGKVTTYGELARAIGNPKAIRAVGSALRKNPFAPIVSECKSRSHLIHNDNY